MVIRYGIRCGICGHPHVLRISIGYESLQKHSFECRNCSQPIDIALELDQENAGSKFCPIKNCVPDDSAAWGDTIVNLSPIFGVPADMQGKDGVFPSFEAFREMLEHRPDLFENAPDARTLHPAQRSITMAWSFASAVWTLAVEKREEVLAGYIERERSKYGFDQPISALDILWQFVGMLGGLSAKNVKETIGAIFDDAAKTSPAEVTRFVEWYFPNRLTPDLIAGREMVGEFMQNFDEFSQLLARQQIGIAELGEQRVSSRAFAATKMFYGNAFERLGNLLALPIALVNVAQGRKFDQLNKFSLDQWLASDKGSRKQALTLDARLAVFEAVYRSDIRNASHHADTTFDAQTGEISYIPARGQPPKTISYEEYIVLSNGILLAAVGIVQFILELMHSAIADRT